MVWIAITPAPTIGNLARQGRGRGAERDACQDAKGAKYFEVTGVLWIIVNHRRVFR